MIASSYSFAKLLHILGTDEQKKLAKLMVDQKWTATMVLTEPDAGSDVGAGRTKAVQNADGTWNITGVKRFITSAEMDLSDNIVHFVLARPEGAGPGTKGLSLFVVPKFHIVDLDTGELGERNGAVITNVEHKMGLKVSTTCEVTFGDGTPAVGTLLGDVHEGIAQMFRVIEHARMMVGTKSIATLSTGYLNALDYAKQRVQGADLTQQADKTAPRVTITHHPDVRRSLMLQKSYAEGLRALVLYTATQQDIVEAAQLAAGSEELPEDSPAQLARRVNDLLLPVVKALGSERAWVLLVRPGRQDRHPLRGHHGDPGARLLLPQDRQGPGRRDLPRGHAGPGVRQGPGSGGRRVRQGTRAARAGPGRRPGHPRVRRHGGVQE
jgi:alkylation response protein AidB-like acyl-CoA dehydrogenase